MMNLRRHLPMLLLPVLAAALSCSRGREEPLVRESFLMGTKAAVTIYGLPADEAEAAASAGLREMHRLEAILSTWRPDSELSLLNAASGGEPVRVSSEIFELLAESYLFSELTGGAFDVTARPLVRLWGFQREAGDTLAATPSDQEIEAARGRVGWRNIVFNMHDSTVTLTGGVTIDVAGIGKGYAVDRCASVLIEHGVKSALVNLGGNMYAIGRPPGRKGWAIGIRDPESPREIVGTLLVEDEGVATSADYENFVVIGGRRYGHIIDPRSGRPAEDVLSVTAIAASAAAADALSTGLFVLGFEMGRLVGEAYPSLRAVFALPDGTYDFIGRFGGRLEIGPGAARDNAGPK